MNARPTSRFDIDPSNYSKDATYLAVFAIWGLLVVGFGAFCFFKGFWVLGSFSCLLLLIIPVSWSKRNDVDSILISDDAIQILKNNKPTAATQIKMGAKIELTLEFVIKGRDTESIPTLNLWDTYQGYRRRHVLGMFISHSHRENLFDQLVTFFENSEISVQSENKLKVESSR